MIAGLLAAAAPLLLAALGGLLTDLAGSLGIFLEGFMVLGAFFSWTAAQALDSILLGTLTAALGSAAIGWMLSRFVKITGANPFIVGLALNLAASGVTEALSTAWYGTKGVLRDPAQASGPAPFVYAAWTLAVVTGLFIERSKPGLRLRAAGAAPEAAAERGINVQRYRDLAWAAAAGLAALSGAALTFRVGAYAPGGSAGRGWIALAAVYLGFRRTGGVAAAAVLFAAAEQLGSAAQGASVLPATVLLGLPATLALTLFSLSRGIGKFRASRRPPS